VSAADLERRIELLPNRIGLDHVFELREATGKRVGNKERQLLEGLLQDHYRRFTVDGLFALEVLVGKAAPSRIKTVWKIVDRNRTNVAEQSAMAFISGKHGFLVVDDETSVLWAVSAPRGNVPPVKTALRKDDGKLKGLEGVVIDHESRQVLTVSENRCTVHVLSLDTSQDAPKLGKPKLLGTLPKPSKANKGWEGLAILPGSASPDKKPRLVTVQEGKPAILVICDRHPKKAGGKFEVEAKVPLPAEITAVMPDLSDLAFDPKTGHLMLLSDEGRGIYECALGFTRHAFGGRSVSTWGLVPIGHTELPELTGDIRLQAEGLDFDAQGDLFIIGEGRTSLLHLHRQSRALSSANRA